MINVNQELTFTIHYDLPEGLELSLGAFRYFEDTIVKKWYRNDFRNEEELKDRIHKLISEVMVIGKGVNADSLTESVQSRLISRIDTMNEVGLINSVVIKVPEIDDEIIVEMELSGEVHIFRQDIREELKTSYMDYAMSVIIGRALPDVRDGLKPVHRRSLYAMHTLGNTFNSTYKKSARVVGDIIGKYHPHGDTAVYETIVRLAQDFSMRYMLVNGQGNFGSIDGDSPAAMRYTEIKMQQITNSVIDDLDKNTVDMIPTYDSSDTEPSVMPTKLPLLLLNGSSGIAVGLATNIPPHNLTEIGNAVMAMVDNDIRNIRNNTKHTLSVDDLLDLVSGPDFPTGGIICGDAGIKEAYTSGKGKIYVRAKYHFETVNRHESIVIDELPYQVNKARLQEKMSDLVRNKRIEGIAAIRDESDKDGIRLVIEVKNNADVSIVLNNLMKYTYLRTTFGINMIAIDDNQPVTLSLHGALSKFIDFRREVITRRTLDLRDKALTELETIDGKLIVHENADVIVDVITNAEDVAASRDTLLSTELSRPAINDKRLPDDFIDMLDTLKDAKASSNDSSIYLSVSQVKTVLAMPLSQLVKVETAKLLIRRNEVINDLIRYFDILTDNIILNEVILNETEIMIERFGDERRTDIEPNYEEMDDIDFYANDPTVITLTTNGYIKRQELSEYNAQSRGGRGKSSGKMRSEDEILELKIATTHDWVLLFTNHGKVFKMRAFELPEGSRTSRGIPVVNYLALSDDEYVTSILTITEFESDNYILFATACGLVKKTSVQEYENVNARGKIAINLTEDSVVGVALTNGSDDIMLFSDDGKVVRFKEELVRPLSRTARGVCGISLTKNARVISLVVPGDSKQILTITNNGIGKVTKMGSYPVKGRANKGYISIKLGKQSGSVIKAIAVNSEDDMIIVTGKGTIIRTPIDPLISIGRNTIGVILIDVRDKETKELIDEVIDIQVIKPIPDIDNNEDSAVE